MDLFKTVLVVCGIVSQSVAVIVTYPGHSGNNWNIYANNQFQRPAEAMTKPIDTIAGSSSYSIPFGYNYPISGDYRATVNMITPSMSYEQSVENPGIDSTTYINYTPQRIQSNGHVYQHGDHSFLQPSVNIPSMSGQSYPSSNSLSTSQNSHIPLQESYYPSSKPVHEETSEPSYYSMSDSEQKTVQPSYYSSPSSVQEISQVRDTASIESSSYFPSKYGFTFQAAQLQTQYEPDSIEEPTLLSQHFEVTKPIAVPVYKKYPYAVNKRFPVAISHPVLVPVPHPYPVNVQISHPVAVPVIKEIKVPIEKEVLYPVEKHVAVHVEKPVSYEVEKHYPVYVNKPYPVKIPIIKTIVHKNKKYSQ